MSACDQASAISVAFSEDRIWSRTIALEPVRRHLMVHGRDYFPSLQSGLRVSSEPVRRPSTNPLYRFVISDGCRTFAVIAKWAPVYQGNNEGKTEYLHYRNFHNRYGSDSLFRCPKPVAFLANQNVLLTEESIGLCLRGVLKAPQISIAKNHGHTVQVLAEWLEGFHRTAPQRTIPLSSAWEVIEEAAPWIKEEAFADEVLSGIVTAQMYTTIRELRRSLHMSSFSCRMGVVHRDFGPGNVIVSNKHVIVCDAAYNGLGPQLLDIADFIAYLKMLPIMSFRCHTPYRFLSTLFLTSYFRSSTLNMGEKALLKLLILGALARNVSRHLHWIRSKSVPLRFVAGSYSFPRYRRAFQEVLDGLRSS